MITCRTVSAAFLSSKPRAVILDQQLSFSLLFTKAHRMLIDTTEGDMTTQSEAENNLNNTAIRRAQDDSAVDIYNHIAREKRNLNIIKLSFQNGQETAQHELREPIAEHAPISEINDLLAEIQGLAKPISLIQARLLVLEEFEKCFRSEWKQKKKASLEQREVFVERKIWEAKGEQKAYKAELQAAAEQVSWEVTFD